ncbi:MAG: KH domain-containing protein [Chloroflexia bacterium]|jgi:predicted RNA-binding protein YlqC (UPF0109 family)
MRELVEYLAKNLVDNPDAVRVRESRSEYVIRVQLHVDPEDKGKVIGREGKIARAMRALVSAAASREGKRGVLEID